MLFRSSDHVPDKHALERNIRLFYAFRILFNLQFWLPIWVLYLQRERGLSLTEVALLDGPFWLIIVAAEVPTGALADRRGRAFSLLAGALTNAAGMFVFGLATNYPLLLASYALWGVSLTLVSGADVAFLYDTLVALGRENEFRKKLGRAQACATIGFVAGSLLGAPLAAATNLVLPILLSSAVTLVAAGLTLWMREPHHTEERAHGSYMRLVRDAARVALGTPGLRWMIAFQAVIGSAFTSVMIFQQPYLASFGVPVSRFGLVMAPLRLFSIVGALLAWRIIARLGERHVVRLVLLSCIVSLVVIGAVPSVTAFALFGLMSFANSVFYPAASDVINRQSPARIRATVASVGQMGSSLALAIAEPGLGAVADHASLHAMFGLLALWVAVAGGVSLLLWLAVSSAGSAREHEPEPVLAGE